MLAKIAAMPKSKREVAMQIVAREEWNRCADDVFYWLDPKAHLFPYVYTKDPKPMYVCQLCQDGVTYHFDKRTYHLLNRHSIEASKESECRQYFNQLDTIRPFPLYDYFIPILETLLKEQLVAIEKSRDMM